MTRTKRRMWSAWVSLGLLSAVVLAACGGGGSTSDTTGSGKQGGTSSSAEAKVAEAELATLYEGEYGRPAPSAPAHDAGENVWAIVVGYQSAGAKFEAEEFKAGAEELGWNPTLRDGKFDPSVELAAIREAVRAQASAIWLESIDCEPMRAGLLEAKEAGIVVVATNSYDCAQPLFSAQVNVMGNLEAYLKRAGEAQAIWAIAHTDAEAKVLLVYETDFATAKEVNAAARRRLEKCESCEVVGEVGFTGGELGPPLQQKVEQALLRYPEVTVVDGNYDAPVEDGVAAAVRASGRQISVLGFEGEPNNIELVRNGEQAMGVGYPNGWIPYAALDAINRILAGEESIGDSGAGLQVFDDEHNLPPKGEGFRPPVDYKKLYREAWGVR